MSDTAEAKDGLNAIDRVRLELHLSNEYLHKPDFEAEDVDALLVAYDALLAARPTVGEDARDGEKRISFPRWWVQHVYTALNRINTAKLPGSDGDTLFTLRHQLLDKLNDPASPAPSGWREMESAPDDEVVLVACPAQGFLPVLAWKVEDTWWEYGIYGKELRPQPTIWTRWPDLPAPPVTHATGERHG